MTDGLLLGRLFRAYPRWYYGSRAGIDKAVEHWSPSSLLSPSGNSAGSRRCRVCSSLQHSERLCTRKRAASVSPDFFTVSVILHLFQVWIPYHVKCVCRSLRQGLQRLRLHGGRQHVMNGKGSCELRRLACLCPTGHHAGRLFIMTSRMISLMARRGWLAGECPLPFERATFSSYSWIQVFGCCSIAL
jgi:hypothetical protein